MTVNSFAARYMSRVQRSVSFFILGASLSHCKQPPEQSTPLAAQPAEPAAPAPSLNERAMVPASLEINPRLLRRFAPIANKPSTSNPVTPEKIELGRMLFHETRLSKNHDISCNSCHALENYGVDGKPTSPGHKGQLGSRNSPTVYNSAHHFQQFWDGRASTVEAQATGPIVNPVEMASSEAVVLKTLNSIPEYVALFDKAFPEDEPAVTFANVGKALGAFERQLDTSSRWDKFIAGEKAALTDAEKQGLQVFLNSGCMVCHTGPQVGAAMFQKVGAVEPWPNQKDQGRFEVTQLAADRMMFKVPSLRNIVKTAPYFHDGSAATLDQAIRMMGRHQLGLELSDSDVAAIITWMDSLTGELPKDLIGRPTLPSSSTMTPKPSAG
jgi:cytochrome c peroxidase